jgi:3-oxoacyl-[acyl-carrier-protein] synthase-1
VGEHPFFIDQVGDPMSGAFDAELDPRMLGPERFLALARPALIEACAPLVDLPGGHSSLPLYLSLPEYRPGFTERDAMAVRDGIRGIGPLSVEIADVSVAPMGHAAGLTAITAASQRIAAGALDACLVGGIESYFQPETMEWLDANLQLAGAVSRSGFVPGEGAAFNVLMSAEACERSSLQGLVHVRASSTGRETNLIKTGDRCLGMGLTQVVQEVVSSVGEDGPIDTVICDVNGERYRAEEWAFVCVRLGRHFVDAAAYQSPADCWGDMGAASGPLFAMLACMAALGKSAGRNTLIWASSEHGLRGAAILERLVED